MVGIYVPSHMGSLAVGLLRLYPGFHLIDIGCWLIPGVPFRSKSAVVLYPVPFWSKSVVGFYPGYLPFDRNRLLAYSRYIFLIEISCGLMRGNFFGRNRLLAYTRGTYLIEISSWLVPGTFWSKSVVDLYPVPFDRNQLFTPVPFDRNRLLAYIRGKFWSKSKSVVYTGTFWSRSVVGLYPGYILIEMGCWLIPDTFWSKSFVRL